MTLFLVITFVIRQQLAPDRPTSYSVDFLERISAGQQLGRTRGGAHDESERIALLLGIQSALEETRNRKRTRKRKKRAGERNRQRQRAMQMSTVVKPTAIDVFADEIQTGTDFQHYR